jgi:hypothetical protein
MGKISDIAASCYGTNVLQKNAFCVGYVHALRNIIVELSNAQAKDIHKLMQTWLHDAQELLQELEKLQTYREDKP